MNLDDLNHFRMTDTHALLAHIDALPEAFSAAWDHAQTLTPGSIVDVQRVVIVPAQGAPMLAAKLAHYFIEKYALSVLILPDIDDWMTEPDTLLVTVGADTIYFAQKGQRWDLINQERNDLLERLQFGTVFATLLALFTRWGLLAEPDWQGTIAALEAQRERIRAEVPATQNPAKRLAGQFVGRLPVICGGELFALIALRWKQMLNENAKTWAQAEDLDEETSLMSGVMYPQPFPRLHCVFLSTAERDPRLERVQNHFLQQGISTDMLQGEGDSALAHALTAVQFGDYVSYYLAMAYGVDPTPTFAIE